MDPFRMKHADDDIIIEGSLWTLAYREKRRRKAKFEVIDLPVILISLHIHYLTFMWLNSAPWNANVKIQHYASLQPYVRL
jgi:hypothetical protein